MKIEKIISKEDFKEIMEIENKAFTYPYTEELFLHDFLYHPYSIYFKQIVNGKIIGYAGLWIIDDTSQITTIAVNPDYQNQGYGSMLLEYIIDYVKSTNCVNITLEVRISNDKALKLYRKFNFYKAAKRQHYYENGEDAFVMMLDLTNN